MFSASKLIAENYHHLVNKLSETMQNFYDPNWLPENFVTIKEVSSEFIQQLKTDHLITQFRNHKAEKQPFAFTNIIEKIIIYLEALPTEQNLVSIIH